MKTLAELIKESSFLYDDWTITKAGVRLILRVYENKRGVTFSVVTESQHHFTKRGEITLGIDDGILPGNTGSKEVSVINKGIDLYAVKGIRVTDAYSVNKYLCGNALAFIMN